MTDLATLAIAIDSRQAGSAASDLDRLTQAGTRTEQAMQRVTASAGQQRAGMQQLSYQIGDVAQQFALGTNPMIIFAQQGQQVVQALALVKGEATGLIGFLGGPWGAVIMGAVTVAGMFASKLYETGDAAKSAGKDFRSAADEARGLVGAMNALKLNQKQMDLNKLTEQRLGLENLLATGIRSGSGIKDRNAGFFSTYQQVSSVEAQIRALRLQEAEAGNLVKIAEQQNSAADKLTKTTERGTSAHVAHAGAVRAHAAAGKQVVTVQESMAAAIMRTTDALDRSTAAFTKQFLGYRDMQQSIAEIADADMKDVREDMASKTAERVQPYLDAAEAARNATARWNTELEQTLDALARMGGAGRSVAAFTDALRGNFNGLSGGAAVIAQTLTRIPAGTTNVGGKDVAVTLGDRIERIFDGPDSKFGKTLKGALEGAGTGIAIGSALFGQNNQGAQLGGAIGGAIGQAVGTGVKAISSALGSAAGPIGSVVGSVLGAVLGGALSKKPRGSGTVSNTGVTSSANDAGIKAGLDSFGLGLQQAVGNIAQQLGGTVGDYSVGIGRYKDYYQVSRSASDPYLGQTYYNRKSSNAAYDGLDGAAALRTAISVAIEQGAIQGVRAGTQTLLRAGSDIEAQLAKALKFQAVFDDLKEATDPVGFALDQVTKKFTELKAIFAEAGATAADYADLEKLMTVQRQDALDKARRDLVSKVSDPVTMATQILDLLGESERSVTAARILELAGLKDSLQPMQAMIYTLTDARSVIEKFTPLRDDLTKFRDELLGGSAGGGFGFLTAKFRETALAAANGDAAAMGNLRGAGNDYLAAAKDNASSLADYNRARAEVLAATDKAIFAADSQIDYQQAVIDAAKANGAILADLNANLASLASQLLTTQADVARIIKRWDGGDNGAPFQVEVVTS